MSVKLSNNPTCVLTDADMYTDSQRARMAKNLMTGIPATSGEGDKVLVLDENGDPQLKDYAGGGGGGSSSYTAGDGIDITGDTISAKVDGTSITVNASGELQAAGGSSGSDIRLVEYGDTSVIITPSDIDDMVSNKTTILLLDSDGYGDYGYHNYRNGVLYNAEYNSTSNPYNGTRVTLMFIRSKARTSSSSGAEVVPIEQTLYTYSLFIPLNSDPETPVWTKTEGAIWSISGSNASWIMQGLMNIPRPDNHGEDVGKVLKVGPDNTPIWVTP